MKLYILTILLVAGVTSRLTGFKRDENGNYRVVGAHIKNSEDFYPGKQPGLLKALSFINHHPFRNEINDLNEDELEHFIEQLNAISLSYDVDLNGNSDSYGKKALKEDKVHVPGFGTVNKNSPLWEALNEMSAEEKVIFSQKLKEIKKKRKEKAILKHTVNNIRDNADINVKFNGLFPPGLDFVHMRSILKGKTEKERAAYMKQLEDMKKEKKLVRYERVRRGVTALPLEQLEQEIDVENEIEDLKSKRVAWVPGLGFVQEGSDLWNIVKNMGSDRVEDLVKKVNDELDERAQLVPPQKYTAIRGI